MELTYQLTLEDFLAFQMYASSKSALHRSRRQRGRFLIPIIYVVFAGFIYFSNRLTLLALIFLGIAVLWLLLYPLYAHWLYKRHFTKHLAENYKNRVGHDLVLKIEEDALWSKDHASESRTVASEFKTITELPNHFFLKLHTDISFIVPKRAIPNQEAFKNRIMAMGAQYEDETHWKWK